MERIVFSDVDGTLLNEEHQITPLTLYAIRALQEKNIPFVIVSARSPSGIRPILREYSLSCPIIAYNGALILDSGGALLFHQGMDKPAVRRLIDFIEKNRFPLSWCVYSPGEWIVKDRSDPQILREESIVKAVSRQGTVDSIADEWVSKVLCICDPAHIEEIETELKAAFPEFSIMRSSGILLEIVAQGVSKAAAVRTFCAMQGIALSKAVAFGDNYNDAEMLEAAGCGILMGNAPPPLKERILIHTTDNSHDGIYRALAKLHLIQRK